MGDFERAARNLQPTQTQIRRGQQCSALWAEVGKSRIFRIRQRRTFGGKEINFMSIDFENLKKEDFDTKAPFEYLFSIESKFERWTERRKLEKKAGDLGLAKKDFTEMCKAFEADMKEKRRKAEEERKQAERQKREQEEAERQALRELQEEERQRKREEAMQELPAMNSIDVPGFDLDFVPCTGEWLVNSSGVYKFTGFGQQIWACLCPVAISRCFVNIDSGNEHVETVVLLSQRKPDDIIRVGIDLDELDITAAESKATYQELKDYILKTYGLKVSSLYISQVKRKHGLDVGENYNLAKNENPKVPICPPEKEDAIVGALKHFQML